MPARMTEYKTVCHFLSNTDDSIDLAMKDFDRDCQALIHAGFTSYSTPKVLQSGESGQHITMIQVFAKWDWMDKSPKEEDHAVNSKVYVLDPVETDHD